jgi:hypothetical protein
VKISAATSHISLLTWGQNWNICEFFFIFRKGVKIKFYWIFSYTAFVLSQHFSMSIYITEMRFWSVEASERFLPHLLSTEFACGCQQMYYQWRRRCRKEMMNCMRWRFSHPIWSDVKCQRWYDKMHDAARARERRIFILMMLWASAFGTGNYSRVCAHSAIYIRTCIYELWPRGLCMYFVGQWSVGKQLFVCCCEGLMASTFLLRMRDKKYICSDRGSPTRGLSCCVGENL